MNESITADKSVVIDVYSIGKRKVKKAFEAVYGKKTFLPDVKQRINNFDDVLKEQGVSKKHWEALSNSLSADTLAYEALKLIVKTYNEGKIPDYTNINQRKYFPRWVMGDKSGAGFSYDDFGSWHSCSGVGARLDFLDYENMIDATTKFQDWYKLFLTVNN